MTRRLVATALILCLCFTGFSVAESAAQESSITVKLYYPRRDLSGLNETAHVLDASDGETLPYVLLAALLQKQTEVGNLPLFGNGAKLLWIENGLSVVTVSVDSYEPLSDRYRELSALAVWKTLSENTSVRGVNVILDSAAVCFNTMGAVRNAGSEYEELREAALQNRLYTVYRPDRSGSCLVPVLEKPIADVPDENALAQYLGADTDESGLLCTWPGTFRLEDGLHFSYGFTESGRRILDISYTEPQDSEIRINAAFEQSGMQQWQFIAALVMTYSTNIASVERIRIKLMDLTITGFTGADGGELSFTGGEIARRDFHKNSAAVLKALVPDGKNRYFTVEQRLVSISGTRFGKDVLLASLSALLDEGDIRRVVLADGCAFVDLSAQLYARCQKLDAQQETSLVYAIVNAACLNLGVNTVRISVEGRQAERFAGSIPLDKELYPNYGIMK